MRIALPSLVFSVVLASSAGWAQSEDRASMLGWINSARAAEGLPALAGDARLDAVADAHSRDMATQRFFSHTSPTTGGPGERASTAGIAHRGLAENIAMNQNARAAHEALLRSPGHRANLMSPTLRRVGLGFARGPDGLYVTQLFATLPDDEGAPAVASPRVPVAPRVPPIPATPTAPSQAETPAAAEDDADDALPQVIRVIPSLLDPRRWGGVLPNASRTPRAPARVPPPPSWTIPTPFGPMRVAVSPLARAPQVAQDARPDPGDDDCDDEF